jgi:hypothetical protein
MDQFDRTGRPQRSIERVACVCLAWVEGHREDAMRGLARTVDISTRGVGLILSSAFESGVRVTIELLMPGHLRLRATGEVAHVERIEDGYRVGVRFDAAPVLVD